MTFLSIAKRVPLLLLCSALMFSTGADARAPHHARSASQPDEAQLIEHRHYTNKSGHEVHSPAHTKDGGKPKGATAQCGDGTYSFSEHHRGTCSHHGGVASWL
jgi:hypothetical protein